MTPPSAQAVPSARTMPLSVVSAPIPWRHTFISLRVRNFRLFACAHFLAVVAVWMHPSARTGWSCRSPAAWPPLALRWRCGSLPALVLGPWGGVLADRLPKRAILLVTQSVAGVLAAVLAVLSLGGAITVWQIYLVALVLGLVTVVDQPARQVFNEMVGPVYLRNALSVISTLFQLGGLAGPALGGLLLTLVGAGWAFAANAVACCLAVADADPDAPERTDRHGACGPGQGDGPGGSAVRGSQTNHCLAVDHDASLSSR